MRLQTTVPETSEAYTYRPIWPDAVAYREAIQNPYAVLGDPELQSAEVILDRRGLPVAYSGRFAVVFRLRTATGDWALRCFTQSAESGERRTHYAAVEQRLALAGDYLVPFRYLENGIRIGTRWYPAVAMRWVGGETLGRFVDRHHQDPVALHNLSVALAQMLACLEQAGIAHGDWQHDNILVARAGQQITLVDYDGMIVPELAGRPSLELGHPNYQHPARSSVDAEVGLDRFSHLVMQTALAALCQDSSLWLRFNDGESLLFKRSDFTAPERSPAFQAVRRVAGADPELRQCLEKLEAACAVGAPAEVTTPQPMAAVGPQTVSTTASSKWWLSPDLITFQARARPRISSASGTSFRLRLSEAENIEFENINLWTVRASLAARTPLLGVLWMVTANPTFAEFWTAASLLLVGFSYAAWPRKKIYSELIKALTRVDERLQDIDFTLTKKRERLAQVKHGLTFKDSAGFVNYRLNEVSADSFTVYYEIFYDTVRKLNRVGIRTAADLKNLGNVPGVFHFERVALLQLYRELEARAAEEYTRLPIEKMELLQEIAQLEQEANPLRQQQMALRGERSNYPDASLLVYLGKVLGIGS